MMMCCLAIRTSKIPVLCFNVCTSLLNYWIFAGSVGTVDLSPDITSEILCIDVEFLFPSAVSLEISPQFSLGYLKKHHKAAS